MWELDHDPVLPAGHRGLRGAVLVALKKDQPLTAQELAVRFDVTPNALRRHLKQLEEEGAVTFRREVRGVGAPVFAYRLTADGEALFPRAYAATLVDALAAVSAAAGEEGLTAFFRQRWDRLSADARPVLRQLPLHERAQVVGEVMTAHGYMAEVEPDGAGVVLRSFNCPLRAAAERFPTACAVEERYLAELLDARVERVGRIVEGCNACAYRISERASPARDDEERAGAA